eukprot:scaffold8872_cov118-Isochrysis_galbana.AAC.3
MTSGWIASYSECASRTPVLDAYARRHWCVWDPIGQSGDDWASVAVAARFVRVARCYAVLLTHDKCYFLEYANALSGFRC